MKTLFTLILIASTAFIGLAQVEKTIVVEHFTNTVCSSCASKNPALFELLDQYPQVLHIAYHPSSPYSSCVFNQHNMAENDARTNFYDIYGGTPRVVLQGEVIGFQTPILNAGQIDAVLGQAADYSVEVTQSQEGKDQVDVRIVIKKLGQPAGQTQRLYAIIAEKEVEYAAPNGEDLHHEVFRKVLADQEIDIVNVGDSAVMEMSYDIDPEWDEDELIVTAMVQDADSKAVLQAYESPKLNAGPNFIGDEEIISAEGLVYPNPATDIISLSPEIKDELLRLEIYSATGNLVRSFENTENMNISDLPGGMYLTVAVDRRDMKYVGRLVKK
jgi:hypothetical protein